MPESFVTKCTHDSGSATFFSQKVKLTEKELRKISRQYKQFYLRRNYGYRFFEMQYVNIEPKIIVEKYLGDNIRDYKFLCFDGEPFYCCVDVDRFSEHRRNIYDLNWNLQPFGQLFPRYEGNIDKPKNSEKWLN